MDAVQDGRAVANPNVFFDDDTAVPACLIVSLSQDKAAQRKRREMIDGMVVVNYESHIWRNRALFAYGELGLLGRR